MKNLLVKFNLLIIMLAFSAGVIFFVCAFNAKLPAGVTVNGVDVGGKTRAEAAEAVRAEIITELKQKSLTVNGREQKYVFTYPEISFKDNLQTLLREVKKGRAYTAEVSYYLNGISEITARICVDESVPAVEPFAIFNTEGEAFTYCEGNDGLKANRLKLLSDVRASLNGDFNAVDIEFKTVKRTVSFEKIKYDTRLISSFTTYYDGENYARAHNIALAAQKINGTVLKEGEGFSFNGAVGKRTAARGFRTAKIIENGEFVSGVGGGVCQVSTTLFNAALLAGCTVTEFHPHSLAVSYVPPSFDAMVSGEYCDLKFVNDTGYTLYIRAKTGKNSVTFNVYGRGDGAQYGYSSVVTGSIAAPVEKTSDSALVRDGKNGVISEGYLTINRGGETKTVLFRRDKYAPVKRIELEQSEEQVEEQKEEATTVVIPSVVEESFCAVFPRKNFDKIN